MTNYREGSIIKAKVTSIKHYGAFIETKDGMQGLIHISEIANTFIVDINYYLKVGDIIDVKILSIKNAKINASLNFDNSIVRRKQNLKNINQIKNCNFKYGFKTIEKELLNWKKNALLEIKYNSK